MIVILLEINKSYRNVVNLIGLDGWKQDKNTDERVKSIRLAKSCSKTDCKRRKLKQVSKRLKFIETCYFVPIDISILAQSH